MLSQLQKEGLVRRGKDGWHASDREGLLDAFLLEYGGPGGTESFFYSLDALQDVAVSIVSILASQRAKCAVSADVGPDLVTSWRSPTQLIVYVDRPFDASRFGLVTAMGRDDANALVRVPDDASVFRHQPLEAEVDGSYVPLAHETQMIWDLHDLGGDDRLEAASHLKKWLLSSRC